LYDGNIELIDFHSHIIPGVDDGAESPEMSLEMLIMLKKQGVDKVVSTSHYYMREGSIEDFCCTRDEALAVLKNHIDSSGADVPQIIKAAEVKLYPGLWQEENLRMLCVEGTKVLMVEMPYENWSGWMYNEVYALCTRGYLPVIVHIERYLSRYASKDDILKKLLGMSVMVQCNAESFREFRKRRLIDKILMSGKLAAIGSDCHDISGRKPDFDVAVKYIVKKYGSECLEDISIASGLLLKGDIYSLI